MSEALADETIRRMVQRVRPEWRVQTANQIEMGTDALYHVTAGTSGGPRECVLKACTSVDPAEFRPEPYLLTLLDQHTSIPVPKVLGAVDAHEELPAPFFLMERSEGTVVSASDPHPSPDVVERIARDAGRYVGEYHGVGDFQRFGDLRLARDVSHGRAGTTVDGRTLTVSDGAEESWRSWFEGWVEYWLENLDDRFLDLEPELTAFVEDRLDALDRSFDPVLTHHDYTFWNLLIDPETGETEAVLDWGNEFTMESYYDLVSTEQRLSGWAPLDAPLRRRVRDALREGYSATNRLERDPDFEDRRDLYLAVTRLPVLVWFSEWMADATRADRKRAEAKHRRFVTDLQRRSRETDGGTRT